MMNKDSVQPIQFMQYGLNIILCSHPFAKSVFLDALAHSSNNAVLYLDFDLLYSGYIESGLLKPRDNVTIFRPHLKWEESLVTILSKISMTPYTVIIDSLHGMSALWSDRRSIQRVNRSIMLLTALSNEVGTQVMATMMGDMPKHGWAMVPGGNSPSNLDRTFVINGTSNSIRLLRYDERPLCEIFL